MDLLAASLAGLGAVVGLFIGATLGSILWSAIFGLDSSDSSDIPPIVIGGLGCAVLFAWVGIRVAGRLTRQRQSAAQE